MKELEIKRKLISKALLRDISTITNEDIERLNQYITINKATNGKKYYWYLDCDELECMCDMQGNIINIDNSEKFFGI